MIEKYRRNIPLELKSYNQWLWFKKIKNADKKGKVKTIKIPVSPITLSTKGWNLRKQWADFETAINGLPNSGCDGLSFILTKDDPFICIDLDNVSEDKKALVDDFSDTYIEISQSGKGLHIFSKGSIKKNFNNQIEKVEMYHENRCIAMTGELFTVNYLAENKQDTIDKYYKLYSPKESLYRAIESYNEDLNSIPNEDMVLEAMLKHNEKARDLFYGSNLSGDASKDDFQLLLLLNSFTHGNHEMMKSIFLQSALNRMGDKSKRKTEIGYMKYLDESIEKAIRCGNRKYWDYDYHRKKKGFYLE
ncbi:MAG: DNA primase [[Eubacterium] sulci]|jgi:possible phage DNA-polymerase or DNA-primase|nr:DNA primase [[Eubacterium] sulci]